MIMTATWAGLVMARCRSHLKRQTFSLCIGEISDIVDTQSGVHLVRLICTVFWERKASSRLDTWHPNSGGDAPLIMLHAT
ncbi:hypothetical protein DFH94DRAFT_731770 [Russula ochroleuca]|uniref:Uncharacterized protein n=1 Tax=Russula ochroleuca TaxID=152965 RepID=A0A9P5T9V7_9AGAM|nr:hypothetical protein DFH94DRAFT_731770 [Russula ochroleuca]